MIERIVLAIALSAWWSAMSLSFRVDESEKRKAAPHEVSLEAILKQVSRASASRDWRRGDWNHAGLEASLEKLLDCVQAAGKRPRMNLPATFQDVRIGNGNRRLTGAIEVVKGGSFSFVDKSILLIDGAADVSSANDSVIIATGGVQVSHGKRNVVLAGYYIEAPGDMNSLLLSGSVLKMAHAKGSICAAPTFLESAHANDVVFLNSKHRNVRNTTACREVETKRIDLGLSPRKNALERLIRVTDIQPPKNRQGGSAHVRLRQSGEEHVAHVGKEIKSGQGRLVPDLEGWRLCLAGEIYALFTDGKEFAGFLVGR